MVVELSLTASSLIKSIFLESEVEEKAVSEEIRAGPLPPLNLLLTMSVNHPDGRRCPVGRLEVPPGFNEFNKSRIAQAECNREESQFKRIANVLKLPILIPHLVRFLD